VAKLVDADQR